MANIVPFAFKGELASGTHNFASGGNTFKIALYTSICEDCLFRGLEITILGFNFTIKVFKLAQ